MDFSKQMLNFDEHGHVKLPETFESVKQILTTVVDAKGNVDADKYADAIQSISIAYQGALLYQSHTLNGGLKIQDLSDDEKKVLFDQQDTLVKFAKTILTLDTSVRIAKALSLINTFDNDDDKLKFVQFLDSVYGNQLVKAAMASKRGDSL